jgi:hypothetical protein
MHFHVEVLIPPSVNIEDAVDKALAPFDKNAGDTCYAFYDWYKIGGRWSGSKLEALLGEERIDAFIEEVKKRKFTISNVQVGKPTLKPESQQKEVDELWHEHFPELELGPCLLFSHSGPRHPHDICHLKDIPLSFSAHRVLFVDDNAAPLFMLTRDFWNGVSFQRAAWNGTLEHALEIFKIEHINWMTVTVDCHS